MNWVEQLLSAFLKWIEGVARKDQTNEDAKRDPNLLRDLQQRIAAHEQRMRDEGDLCPKRGTDATGPAGEGQGVGEGR